MSNFYYCRDSAYPTTLMFYVMEVETNGNENARARSFRIALYDLDGLICVHPTFLLQRTPTFEYCIGLLYSHSRSYTE